MSVCLAWQCVWLIARSVSSTPLFCVYREAQLKASSALKDAGLDATELGATADEFESVVSWTFPISCVSRSHVFQAASCHAVCYLMRRWNNYPTISRRRKRLPRRCAPCARGSTRHSRGAWSVHKSPVLH